MDRLTRMIPESNLKYLRDYKFHAGEPTPLDVLIARIWWTPVANMLPRWLSPNVITLMGALCIFFVNYCIFTYVPNQDFYAAPEWIPGMIAFMVFLYLTFDGIDGKHARNLGVSSPLGQLLDHGVDAVVTAFYPYMCFTIFPGGFSFPVLLCLIVAPLHVLGIIWRESEFSTFSYTNGIIGVTEANLGMALIHLGSYYYKPMVSTKILYRFSKEVMSTFVGKISPGYIDIPMAILYLVVVVSHFEVILTVFRMFCDSNRRLEYVLYMIAASLHVIPASLLAYTIPQHSKVLGCLFASSVGAIICVNNIVCLLSKAKLRRFHFGLLPFYLLLVQYFGVPYFKGLGYNVDAFTLTAGEFHLVLRGVTIYGALYLLFTFGKTCHEVSTYLGIPLLTVPAKADAKRSH